MRSLVSLALLLALAPAAFAEDDATATAQPSPSPAPMATPVPFTIRELNFGVQGADSDTNSSRFREYSAYPTGVVLPSFHFAGNQKLWYDVSGEEVLQQDAHYHALAEPFGLRLDVDFRKIPHRFGNDAHSLLADVGPGVLAMSDTLQQTFQSANEAQFAADPSKIAYPFLNSLVSPSLAAVPGFDLALLRERGSADLRLTQKDSPVEVHATYFQEKRRGDRAAGTSFGFSNVVETPEPIDYRTRDFGLLGDYQRQTWDVHAAFHYNDFENRVPTESFDNPFRATDSTDSSAYSSPGSGSIGGPAFGRVSLPPDNKAITGSAGFLKKFNTGHSRFTLDTSLGQWSQNDTPFMPMTTNTAIAVPDQGLPNTLDGKIKVFSLSSTFTSDPMPKLHLAARYRRYDTTNDTPRLELPRGYVRFDAVFEAIPRISVPYDYATDALNLSVAYDLDKATIEGGYKLDVWHRNFRETEKTTENVGYLKADVRPIDWLLLRGTAEKGTRGFSGLDLEASEAASFLHPGAPANLLAVPPTDPIYASFGCGSAPCNLRYDQANKDVSRYGTYLELSPGGKVTVTFAYLYNKDDYKDSNYGLLSAKNESFTAEADYTPIERVNVYGFYTHENLTNFQRGRQSGSTVSTNPADNWTSNVDDKGDSFGIGATIRFKGDKVKLGLLGNYQKVNGNNDLASDPNGAAKGATPIPLYDDTEMYTISANLSYAATAHWNVGVGGFFQKYTLQDANTSGLVNYVPSSFFLAADDSNYKAHVVYAHATYAW
jgi:MtrB/PioB family decaheme-associated outer membrane protein